MLIHAKSTLPLRLEAKCDEEMAKDGEPG